jgi:hypothetical protein
MVNIYRLFIRLTKSSYKRVVFKFDRALNIKVGY